MRRFILTTIGLLLMVGAVIYLYRGLDLTLFLAELRQANLLWIAALALAILAEQAVQGWKWRQLLFELQPISSLRLMGAFMAGYGANVVLPLGISPLVRAWLVARLEGLRMDTVLVTTVIARFIDGITFALIAALVAVAGQIPPGLSGLQFGLALASLVNLSLFSLGLGLMFWARRLLLHDNLWFCRLLDWIERRASPRLARLEGLREGVRAGILWPQNPWRQGAVLGASLLMKAIAASHFFFAGLALGIRLELFDYLFLLVVAGFSLILSRFIRIPGGFMLGAGLALQLLEVPAEQALAMILFSQFTSLALVVGVGWPVLWRSGVDITKLRATF